MVCHHLGHHAAPHGITVEVCPVHLPYPSLSFPESAGSRTSVWLYRPITRPRILLNCPRRRLICEGTYYVLSLGCWSSCSSRSGRPCRWTRFGRLGLGPPKSSLSHSRQESPESNMKGVRSRKTSRYGLAFPAQWISPVKSSSADSFLPRRARSSRMSLEQPPSTPQMCHRALMLLFPHL